MEISTRQSFWWSDLKEERRPLECPIKGCKTDSAPICKEHGLKIHKKTFVYYNGDTPRDKCEACLRNALPGGRHFLKDWILHNKNKAETHRLGSENSEDALTWNVFGELHRRGLIHLAYNFLTGKNVTAGQVKLFLWGLDIDFDGDKATPCEFLKKVREELENRIKRFSTEPDIMLLGPEELVLIEAKFTSGNTVSVEGKDSDDEKPKSRDGLIRRYLEDNRLWQPVLCRQDVEHVGERIHSQLLRMIVFASTMAQMMKKKEWKLVNLVSRTQWDKCAHRKGSDYHDPTGFIPAKVRDHFHFLYWEQLYSAILASEPRAEDIAEYMEEKSANLSRAFKFS
jgi:hypothetical protein